MDATVAQMTKDELKTLIEETVEEKLIELFGDPDDRLRLKEEVVERLLKQKRAVERGERGESFDEVVSRVGLES